MADAHLSIAMDPSPATNFQSPETAAMERTASTDSYLSYDWFDDKLLSYTSTSPYGILQSYPESPPYAPNLSTSNPYSFNAFRDNYSTKSPSPTSPGPNRRPFAPINHEVSSRVVTPVHSEDGFSSSGSKPRSERSLSSKRLQAARRVSAGFTLPPSSKATHRRMSRDTIGSEDESNNIDDTLDDRDREMTNDIHRKNEVRRQQIESEQRRRDEIRDAYSRLKDALPPSNRKSSKINLLDRATVHIRYLEMTKQLLHTRFQQAELETQRLRMISDRIMLSAEERGQQSAPAAAAAQASMDRH
ncbi:hypothetical protein BKA62DRAFT_367998 [Auriculariales sp. MPI-PUGE-AT-0066]|nr:hypothetical protein BKA62DRAFT_367998 [Auriculariales sp. MPI-PUGE-AT-0066]